MSPAVSDTVKELELLRLQAGMVQQVVEINTAGLTQEESLIQPPAGGNCLNWVVGHLLAIYNKALPMLGQEPVNVGGGLDRYDRGAPPLRDGAEALELQDLLAGFAKATERFAAGLTRITPETLEQPVPDSPSGNPDETVRTLLATICFHQAYHAGQTGILRRIAGKEGAIP